MRVSGAAIVAIDAVVAGLRARGAELVGELERYEDSYPLCNVRGPEGIIIERPLCAEGSGRVLRCRGPASEQT